MAREIFLLNIKGLNLDTVDTIKAFSSVDRANNARDIIKVEQELWLKEFNASVSSEESKPEAASLFAETLKQRYSGLHGPAYALIRKFLDLASPSLFLDADLIVKWVVLDES